MYTCPLHVLQELLAFHWTSAQNLQKDMAMYSGHGTRAVQQSRGEERRAEERRGGKSAEFALASDRFLDPQMFRLASKYNRQSTFSHCEQVIILDDFWPPQMSPTTKHVHIFELWTFCSLCAFFKNRCFASTRASLWTVLLFALMSASQLFFRFFDRADSEASKAHFYWFWPVPGTANPDPPKVGVLALTKQHFCQNSVVSRRRDGISLQPPQLRIRISKKKGCFA